MVCIYCMHDQCSSTQVIYLPDLPGGKKEVFVCLVEISNVTGTLRVEVGSYEPTFARTTQISTGPALSITWYSRLPMGGLKST